MNTINDNFRSNPLLLMKYLLRIAIFLLCAVVAPVNAKAFSASTSKPWYDKNQIEWGGHFKVRGTVSWPDDQSFYQPVGTGAYYDGSLDFRLKNKVYLADWGHFETHYEAVTLGGDSWRKLKDLEQLYPNLFKTGLLSSGPLNDDRRLMDLTKIISEDNNYIFYHRLDRLCLTAQPKWGTVTLGRQALTWGNGLIFNPMDLFNPFAPTDIERDYKVGDDMAATQFSVAGIGDFQFIYVPRRDTTNNNLEFDQSSLAGKLHFAAGITEFDFMAARHYQDTVVGLGSTGYLKEAAWRLDTTYIFLEDDSRRGGFLSLVANMDYSWVWWEKNFYGLVEFYYNGLGGDQYSEAISDPDISDRLLRGEIFTLGRTYLSGEIQIELHPLFNFHLSVINNLKDPSGIIQPRMIWDIIENVQLTFGAGIYYGASGTEYGGFPIPSSNSLYTPSNNVFCWMTYFF